MTAAPKVETLAARTRAGTAASYVLAWRADARSEWFFRPSGTWSPACSTRPSAARRHYPPPFRAFEVRETQDGKGMGCFALGPYTRGDRVVDEAPLLERSLDAIDDEVRARRPVECMEAVVNSLLSPSQRAEYDDLSMSITHGAQKTSYGIWLSNAYPTDEEPEECGAIFRVISRFNHSCQPNCHVSWNSRTRRMTVHCLTPIRPGEEITVSYGFIGSGDARATRQRVLFRDFGFVCGCTLCRLTGDELSQSDERQARIRALADQIVEGPPNLIALVEERLALLDQEGLYTNWDTYAVAMSFLKLCRDESGAQVWAARAAECARCALGDDSEEFLRYSTATARGSSAGAPGTADEAACMSDEMQETSNDANADEFLLSMATFGMKSSTATT